MAHKRRRVTATSAYDEFAALQERAIPRQAELLQRYGAQSRQALLGASPGLGAISQFLESRFSQPLPQQLQEAYGEQVRSAQAARGFGGGGTGPTGEEARYLFGVAEQQRRELIPYYSGFETQLLGASGLGQAAAIPSYEQVMGAQFKAQEAHQMRKESRQRRQMEYTKLGVDTLSSGLTSGVNYYRGQQQSRMYQDYLNESRMSSYNRSIPYERSGQFGTTYGSRGPYGSIGGEAYEQWRPQTFPTISPRAPVQRPYNPRQIRR